MLGIRNYYNQRSTIRSLNKDSSIVSLNSGGGQEASERGGLNAEEKERHKEFLKKMKIDTILRRQQIHRKEEKQQQKVKERLDRSIEEEQKKQEEKY